MTLDDRGRVARDGALAVSPGSLSIASRWSTSWLRPVPATRSPGGLSSGYLAYRDYVLACQYGNAMVLSAVPARN